MDQLVRNSTSTTLGTTLSGPPADLQSPSGADTQTQGLRGMSYADGANALAPGADPAACGPEEVRLATPVAPLGELSYYQTRHDDFLGRYSDCAQLTPPDYYLGYGNKYVTRFTVDTFQRLSPEGQQWLLNARKNLQIAIENRRRADPAAFDQLEKNNDAFRAFAYATHPDAYWNAGLGELSLFDLASIGMTPDVEDLLAWDGILQVVDIGGRLAGTWGERGIDYVAGEGTTDELVTAAYQGLAEVGDGIDVVFGEGTAAQLRQRAGELGLEAGELAEDAYNVAASAVSYTAGGIDSVFGEGTTSRTANEVRVQAGQAVEVVEGAYDSVTEWAGNVLGDLF